MRALLATAAVLLAVGCSGQARVTPEDVPTNAVQPTEDPLAELRAEVVKAGAAINMPVDECPEDRSLVRRYNDAVRAYNAEAKRLGIDASMPLDTYCD